MASYNYEIDMELGDELYVVQARVDHETFGHHDDGDFREETSVTVVEVERVNDNGPSTAVAVNDFLAQFGEETIHSLVLDHAQAKYETAREAALERR